MAKYIGWEAKPFEMIYVVQNKNPLEYYRLSSKRMFLKVICILPEDDDIVAFRNVLRTNKFEFEHNNHLLSTDINDRWLIAKFFKYSSIINGTYSLKNFSSYDLIWLIERDTVSLKKRLNKCISRLPHDLPKLAIVNNSDLDTSKSFIFKNFGINIVVALHKSLLCDIDKDKRRDLMVNSFELLKNPELGLTSDFVAFYSNKLNLGYPIALCLVAAGIFGLLIYKYKFHKREG